MLSCEPRSKSRNWGLLFSSIHWCEQSKCSQGHRCCPVNLGQRAGNVVFYSPALYTGANNQNVVKVTDAVLWYNHYNGKPVRGCKRHYRNTHSFRHSLRLFSQLHSRIMYLIDPGRTRSDHHHFHNCKERVPESSPTVGPQSKNAVPVSTFRITCTVLSFVLENSWSNEQTTNPLP